MMLGVAGIDYWSRYNKFIAYCRRNPPKDGEPVEKHHVLPRSLFPALKKDKANLISLTSRQHFVAHYILAHMHWPEMAHAFFLLCGRIKHVRVTSRQYAFGKAAICEARKNDANWYDAVSKSAVLRSQDSCWIESNRKHMRKMWSSEDYRKKHLKMLEKLNTPERRAEASERLKRINSDPVIASQIKKKFQSMRGVRKTCEYCGKEISLCNYSRWHGERCMKRPGADVEALRAERARIMAPLTYSKKPKRTFSSNWKRVRCVETGAIYANTVDAAAAVGVSRSAVLKAVTNGYKSGGYSWEVVDA